MLCFPFTMKDYLREVFCLHLDFCIGMKKQSIEICLDLLHTGFKESVNFNLISRQALFVIVLSKQDREAQQLFFTVSETLRILYFTPNCLSNSRLTQHHARNFIIYCRDYKFSISQARIIRSFLTNPIPEPLPKINLLLSQPQNLTRLKGNFLILIKKKIYMYNTTYSEHHTRW